MVILQPWMLIFNMIFNHFLKVFVLRSNDKKLNFTLLKINLEVQSSILVFLLQLIKVNVSTAQLLIQNGCKNFRQRMSKKPHAKNLESYSRLKNFQRKVSIKFYRDFVAV